MDHSLLQLGQTEQNIYELLDYQFRCNWKFIAISL